MRRSLILLLLGFLGAVAVPTQAQYLGEIDLMGTNFAPKGWASCSGQLLPINQNAALFSLLGTTYGGDGMTTFALPDLRGRRVVGAGQGPGLGNYNIGDKGGEETVTLTVDQLPAHSHAVFGSSNPADALGPGGNVWATTAPYLYNAGVSLVPMNGLAIRAATGGGGPHDNMSPYLTMNYVIALVGIYPSRF